MDALVLLCSRMPSNRGRLPGVTLLCTVCLGKFNCPGKFHVSLNRENITRQKYLGFVTSRKSMTHRKKKWMKEVWSLFFFISSMMDFSGCHSMFSKTSKQKLRWIGMVFLQALDSLNTCT